MNNNASCCLLMLNNLINNRKQKLEIMKTMKTTAMIIVAILITNLAMATGSLKVNFSPSGAEIATLEISHAVMSQFEIDVKDDKGDLMFYKKTKDLSTNYKKVYDFSRLEDGTYTLSVKLGNEFTESRFSIERGIITVLDEKKIAEPYFAFENKVFKMTYLNFTDDDLKLYVYGEEGLLKEKKFSNQFAIHDGLDFSKTKNGSYRVILEHGQEMFQYDIVLD